MNNCLENGRQHFLQKTVESISSWTSIDAFSRLVHVSSFFRLYLKIVILSESHVSFVEISIGFMLYRKNHRLNFEYNLPLIYCCFSFGVNGRDSSLLLTLRAVRRLPPYPPRLLCLTTFLRRLIAFVFFAFKLKY